MYTNKSILKTKCCFNLILINLYYYTIDFIYLISKYNKNLLKMKR